MFGARQVNTGSQGSVQVVVHRATGQERSFLRRQARWVSRSRFKKAVLLDGLFCAWLFCQDNAIARLRIDG